MVDLKDGTLPVICGLDSISLRGRRVFANGDGDRTAVPPSATRPAAARTVTMPDQATRANPMKMWKSRGEQSESGWTPDLRWSVEGEDMMYVRTRSATTSPLCMRAPIHDCAGGRKLSFPSLYIRLLCSIIPAAQHLDLCARRKDVSLRHAS